MSYQQEFEGQLYQVMADRAPKLLRQLQKSGQLKQYLQAKGQEAQDLRRQLLKPYPSPGLREYREAEEQVRGLLMEFSQEDQSPPPDFPEPPDDLPGHPGSQGRLPTEHRMLVSKARATLSRPEPPDDLGHPGSSESGEQSLARNTMQRAVWHYGWERFGAFARKVIHRLQRLDASGIYGDDYGYKTLWDEFCHEVQYGPSDDIIDSAWNTTIQPFLEAVIGSLTDKEKAVLFFATETADDFEDDVEPVAPIDDDALAQEVLSALKGIAGKRHLERFECNWC